MLLTSLPQALFFPVKMATQDLTSPVAAMYLAAGAFFLVKMATQDLTSQAGPGGMIDVQAAPSSHQGRMIW